MTENEKYRLISSILNTVISYLLLIFFFGPISLFFITKAIGFEMSYLSMAFITFGIRLYMVVLTTDPVKRVDSDGKVL